MPTIIVPYSRKSLPTRGLQSTPAIWMDEKRYRDTQLWENDNSNLWIVESKLYDLSSFATKHPGGEKWITMTRGQYITEHFVVHHLNEGKAREELAKYYVADCKKNIKRFTFYEDGLYRTVKRRVLDRMSVKEIQDGSVSKRRAYIILVAFIVTLLTTAYTSSYIAAACCSILLLGMLGIGHNFIHHKTNPFRHFYLPTGFTADEWQIMHCLSHHIYPNLYLDYEISTLYPIAYFLRSRPYNKVYTYPLLLFVFIFLQPLNMLLKLILVPLLKKKKPYFLYAVPFGAFLLFYLFSGNVWLAIKLHFVMYGFFGFICSRVLFCGHRLQELWTEGAEKIYDFGEHTIRTTSDTDIQVGGLASYILLAGFNLHTPHHLFPTADHSALENIFEIIREVCKEKGISMSQHNRFSCMVSLSKGIRKRIAYLMITMGRCAAKSVTAPLLD